MERRFTDKPDLAPEAVRSLPIGHPALVENRTLFPTTVVDVNPDYAGKVLVSGVNNRKLGETVTKGKFKGYALYGLSLEERATCPVSCSARAFCYGNGMQMARRHRISDPEYFYAKVESEIAEILAGRVEGLLIRLHVLGDFPSVDYVAFWSDMLAEHEKLACYGYTHRLSKNLGGDEIGDAIMSLKSQYPDRFRIRWSADKAFPDGAIVSSVIPATSRTKDGIVCPAQTDATACCASCGLCWEASARKETIVFIKHGPKSDELAAERAMGLALPSPEVRSEIPTPTVEGIRPIAKLNIPQKRDRVMSAPPEMRLVSPLDLKVESSYQRDLSAKSISLIRKIVTGWDWTKYKPPVCAETDDGLFIIDGQHTALAAASHPEIQKIPVMVLKERLVERRADAFVAHNRDRLVMTAAQVFYGEAAAGNKEAKDTLEAVLRAGGSIPRLPINKSYAKPGQVTAVNAVRRACRKGGMQLVERIIRIAIAAKVTPINATVIHGLEMLLFAKPFKEAADQSDVEIAAVLGAIKNLDSAAEALAIDAGRNRYWACASLIANELGKAEAA